jgi:hypothetical protein
VTKREAYDRAWEDAIDFCREGHRRPSASSPSREIRSAWASERPADDGLTRQYHATGSIAHRQTDAALSGDDAGQAQTSHVTRH